MILADCTRVDLSSSLLIRAAVLSRPKSGRGDISDDIGKVKTHVLRSARRSRLSPAKESAEAAVAPTVRVGAVHPFTLALFTVIPVLPTKHLFGHNGP